MKKRIITILSIFLVTMLFVIGFSGCASNPAGSYSNSGVTVTTQPQGIWVSGTGKVNIMPDIALLRLGIESQEVSVNEAQSRASEAMNKVMAALDDSGVEKKDIQTQEFRISQRTRWDDNKQREITVGYRVTNSVMAKIRDIEKVGEIIDAVVAAGGDYTRIDYLDFTVDDPTSYYEEARQNAIADAKKNAEQIAGFTGMKLGDPTYISESTTSPVYESAMGGMALSVPAPAPSAPSISPGEIEIRVTIQIAYDIK
jgi:uncharacterized protein YggE